MDSIIPYGSPEYFCPKFSCPASSTIQSNNIGLEGLNKVMYKVVEVQQSPVQLARYFQQGRGVFFKQENGITMNR